MTQQQWKNTVAIQKDGALYPEGWRSLSDAPETLFAVGNIQLLKERKFAIVGSRRTPANALKVGAQIAKELSEEFVIVTGTADGGDGAAIEGALLKRVAERGLLLSPYPYETPVRSFSYEYRNKLLAKISEGVLVLGAAEKSGALITAKHAKKFKKPIFALPYAPGSAAGEGCNALLKKGGYLTETAADVLEVFGIEKSQSKPTVTLSADEQRLYDALRELSEGHIGELALKAGVPAFKARSILSALEVKGLAVALGGNRYSVC